MKHAQFFGLQRMLQAFYVLQTLLKSHLVFAKHFTVSCWARQTLVFMSVCFQNMEKKIEWTWTKHSIMIEYSISILLHLGTETNVLDSRKNPLVPIMQLHVKKPKK